MLTRKRKETVYRIWLHMVTPSKPLKKRLRSVSYYAQIVTELKQLNNKTGTHTKKVKGENNGKSQVIDRIIQSLNHLQITSENLSNIFIHYLDYKKDSKKFEKYLLGKGVTDDRQKSPRKNSKRK